SGRSRWRIASAIRPIGSSPPTSPRPRSSVERSENSGIKIPAQRAIMPPPRPTFGLPAACNARRLFLGLGVFELPLPIEAPRLGASGLSFLYHALLLVKHAEVGKG